jgi:hypothetical protein
LETEISFGFGVGENESAERALFVRHRPQRQPQVVKPMKLCISFLVWQIHKPIAGVVDSRIGALQPGKVDNQCVEKIPLFVFRGMERRPPTVGRYPGAYLRSLG